MSSEHIHRSMSVQRNLIRARELRAAYVSELLQGINNAADRRARTVVETWRDAIMTPPAKTVPRHR